MVHPTVSQKRYRTLGTTYNSSSEVANFQHFVRFTAVNVWYLSPRNGGEIIREI